MNDLQKRLLEFSKAVVRFAKDQLRNSITQPLITQLVRSATSIGANYTEAQSGFSRKDFRAKVSIAKKEAEETLYWFELLEVAMNKEVLEHLRNEAEEICKILQAILTKSKV